MSELQLQLLRHELAELTAHRNRIVTAARAAIADANRAYDDEAFTLARKIRRLSPAVPAPSSVRPPPARKHHHAFSLDGTEDWSADERDHYRELAQSTRRG